MSQPSTLENTTTSEEHDQEIEEHIWGLMGKSGLLSELKAQIAQFIQTNGKTKERFSVDVSRAHPEVLALIYEYLGWVGMKNTCAMLLSESPVTFETHLKSVVNTDGIEVPQLYRLVSSNPIKSAESKIDTDDESIKSEIYGFKTSVTGHSRQNALASPIGGLNNTYVLGDPTTNFPGTEKQEIPKSNGSFTNVPETSNVSIGIVTKSNSDHQRALAAKQALSFDNSSNSIPLHDNTFETNVDSKSNSPDLLSNNDTVVKTTRTNDASFGKLRSVFADLSELPLKSSGSDQLLQSKNAEIKDQLPYVFMTEKQKLEAMTKKFGGTDSSSFNTASKDESQGPAIENIKECEANVEPLQLSDIPNPWITPNSIEPDLEEESISDLHESTAEDVTQDLSLDSDSRAVAANLKECDHHIKIK